MDPQRGCRRVQVFGVLAADDRDRPRGVGQRERNRDCGACHFFARRQLVEECNQFRPDILTTHEATLGERTPRQRRHPVTRTPIERSVP